MYIGILVFGDSIAWGCWDPIKGGWVDRLKSFFQKKDYRGRFRIYVHNLSIGAETTDDLLGRFQNETKARVTDNLKLRKHDVIVFAVAINDSRKVYGVNLDRFESNLRKLIKQARKFTSKIIFIGPTRTEPSMRVSMSWRERNLYNNQRIRRYNSALKSICQENKVNFIPVFNLLKQSDLEDGVHPNSKGHQKIFKEVKKFLLENNLIELEK